MQSASKYNTIPTLIDWSFQPAITSKAVAPIAFLSTAAPSPSRYATTKCAAEHNQPCSSEILLETPSVQDTMIAHARRPARQHFNPFDDDEHELSPTPIYPQVNLGRARGSDGSCNGYRRSPEPSGFISTRNGNGTNENFVYPPREALATPPCSSYNLSPADSSGPERLSYSSNSSLISETTTATTTSRTATTSPPSKPTSSPKLRGISRLHSIAPRKLDLRRATEANRVEGVVAEQVYSYSYSYNTYSHEAAPPAPAAAAAVGLRLFLKAKTALDVLHDIQAGVFLKSQEVAAPPPPSSSHSRRPALRLRCDTDSDSLSLKMSVPQTPVLPTIALPASATSESVDYPSLPSALSCDDDPLLNFPPSP